MLSFPVLPVLVSVCCSPAAPALLQAELEESHRRLASEQQSMEDERKDLEASDPAMVEKHIKHASDCRADQVWNIYILAGGFRCCLYNVAVMFHTLLWMIEPCCTHFYSSMHL